jgi:hypothetical protein
MQRRLRRQKKLPPLTKAPRPRTFCLSDKVVHHLIKEYSQQKVDAADPDGIFPNLYTLRIMSEVHKAVSEYQDDQIRRLEELEDQRD